jgi:hypothetical protein
MTNNMVHNCETGEVSFVPFTEEELAIKQEIRLAEEAAEAAKAAREAVRESALAKLTTLGLTEEELSTLTI